MMTRESSVCGRGEGELGGCIGGHWLDGCRGNTGWGTGWAQYYKRQKQTSEFEIVKLLR